MLRSCLSLTRSAGGLSGRRHLTETVRLDEDDILSLANFLSALVNLPRKRGLIRLEVLTGVGGFAIWEVQLSRHVKVHGTSLSTCNVQGECYVAQEKIIM